MLKFSKSISWCQGAVVIIIYDQFDYRLKIIVTEGHFVFYDNLFS